MGLWGQLQWKYTETENNKPPIFHWNNWAQTIKTNRRRTKESRGNQENSRACRNSTISQSTNQKCLNTKHFLYFLNWISVSMIDLPACPTHDNAASAPLWLQVLCSAPQQSSSAVKEWSQMFYNVLLRFIFFVYSYLCYVKLPNCSFFCVEFKWPKRQIFILWIYYE